MGGQVRGILGWSFLGGRVRPVAKLQKETESKQPSTTESGQGPEDGETT